MRYSPDWLHHQAELHPHRLALMSPDGEWTFRALDFEVGQWAANLQALGIGPGTRVAYRMRANANQVRLVHALTRVGAVLVPLNTRLTEQELAPILDNAQPSAIFDEAQALTHDGAVNLGLKHLVHPRSPIYESSLDFDALHAIIYTSGTTGQPKGVEITVGNQWHSALGFALNAGLAHDDAWLHVMPLFHVGGLTILFRSVIHGSTIVLAPRFDAESTYTLLHEHKITLVSFVPTMVHRLLQLRRPAPKTLRLALLGGAPAHPSLIKEAHDWGYPVVPTFGMTETCSQIVTMEVDQVLARPTSSGHANLPTIVKIRGDNEFVGPGTAGEIWVQGPTVARGYWHNAKATQDVFVDGWLKTGDWGYLDAEGYLTVTDRIKDVIIRGGENIYPSEVQAQLLSHPAIDDAAVFALADRQWGQIVAAAVVSHLPKRPADLKDFLSKRLASYKMPSIYFRVTAIERNASGKTLRVRLQEQADTLERWDDE